MLIILFLYSNYAGGCSEVSHCGFALYFPVINDMQHLFMHLLAVCLFLGEMFFQILCPFLELDYFLFIIEL
jgi:hypothetical protein